MPDMPDAPPKVVDVLTPIAEKWLVSSRVPRADPRIPRNSVDLADWWIHRQPLPDAVFDRPHSQSRRSGEGSYWVTPYHDRLCASLKTFLCLDRDFQSLIISCAEDKIFWRGDSREFFIGVINEHEKMRRVGVETYRREAKENMHRFQEVIKTRQFKPGAHG